MQEELPAGKRHRVYSDKTKAAIKDGQRAWKKQKQSTEYSHIEEYELLMAFQVITSCSPALVVAVTEHVDQYFMSAFAKILYEDNQLVAGTADSLDLKLEEEGMRRVLGYLQQDACRAEEYMRISAWRLGMVCWRSGEPVPTCFTEPLPSWSWGQLQARTRTLAGACRGKDSVNKNALQAQLKEIKDLISNVKLGNVPTELQALKAHEGWPAFKSKVVALKNRLLQVLQSYKEKVHEDLEIEKANFMVDIGDIS